MKYYIHTNESNYNSMIIEKYDDVSLGFRTAGNTAFLYHNSIIVDIDNVFDSFEECKKAACFNYGKPVYYNGVNVNDNKPERRFCYVGSVLCEIL